MDRDKLIEAMLAGTYGNLWPRIVADGDEVFIAGERERMSAALDALLSPEVMEGMAQRLYAAVERADRHVFWDVLDEHLVIGLRAALCATSSPPAATE